MKYLVIKICVDGKGIAIRDSLDDAKKEWASLCIEIYESSDEQVDFIKFNFSRTQIDELTTYIQDNCNLVYTDKN